MIQRSCPKSDSTKKSGLHPGTSCGAWPLPRASPVAVPIFKAVVPLHTGAMPAETLRTRASPLFRLKLSVMIYLFLSPATTVGIVNPPFSYGMGQRHVLGQLRVAGAAMCFTAGRIDSVTPRLRCAQPRLVALRCPRPRAGPPPVTFLPPGTESEGMLSSTGSSIPMDTLRISPVDICGRPHILRQSSADGPRRRPSLLLFGYAMQLRIKLYDLILAFANALTRFIRP